MHNFMEPDVSQGIATIELFSSPTLNKVSDPWGALVDWYRDLRVAQVKYELIRDASALEQHLPAPSE